MENKWEYQYNQETPQQPQPTEAQNTGYQNVGSSGTNTANTAWSGTENNASAAPNPGQAYEQPRPQQNTYSYAPGGPAGPTGPYDYTAHYAGGPAPRPVRTPGSGAKWGQRVVAAVLVAAIGFGSGYAGAKVAGAGGSKVVTQTVTRDASETSTSAGSAAMNLSDVARVVSKSVVVITTEQMVTANSWFGGDYVQSGAGSGVIMSSDGYIITCNHVVDGASSVKVSLEGDDTQYDAKIIGGDSTTDIAVIKIEADGLTPAVMGNSDALAVAEQVMAVGNPLGTLGGTVTTGIVSAVNRDVTVEDTDMTLIQTDASVSPGNSGGALFNAAGELVGIVNAKSSSSNAEGIGFAIPINTAYKVAQDLIETGHVTGRPQLGIKVLTISDAQTAAQYGVKSPGLYIESVVEGTGADKAGLQRGDRIVSVGDTLVNDINDITGVVKSMQVGDVLTLQIARDDRLMTVDVTLTESAG